jgi:hypothetical protein
VEGIVLSVDNMIGFVRTVLDGNSEISYKQYYLMHAVNSAGQI